jgi:hypothetical protein
MLLLSSTNASHRHDDELDEEEDDFDRLLVGDDGGADVVAEGEEYGRFSRPLLLRVYGGVGLLEVLFIFPPGLPVGGPPPMVRSPNRSLPTS